MLELGESEVYGKKDQPEAITFISPAKVKIEVETYIDDWNASDEIKKEINRDIFSLSLNDDN
jgi:hypothetical protein